MEHRMHGGCICPSSGYARGLYIREGGRGKQKFVSWGSVCRDCGFIFPNAENAIETMKEQVKFHELVQKHPDMEYWRLTDMYWKERRREGKQ